MLAGTAPTSALVAWLGLVGTGLVIVGGLTSYALTRFRTALNDLRTSFEARVGELRNTVDERLGELEMSQQETNRLAIRSAAQAETLLTIFGTAGRPGGGRGYDPPPAWWPSGESAR